jgi:hypothetical protein
MYSKRKMPDFHIKHLLFHIVQGVFIHGYPTMFLLGLRVHTLMIQ